MATTRGKTVYVVMVVGDGFTDWFVFATKKDAEAYARERNREARENEDIDTRASVYPEVVR